MWNTVRVALPHDSHLCTCSLRAEESEPTSESETARDLPCQVHHPPHQKTISSVLSRRAWNVSPVSVCFPSAAFLLQHNDFASKFQEVRRSNTDQDLQKMLSTSAKLRFQSQHCWFFRLYYLRPLHATNPLLFSDRKNAREQWKFTGTCPDQPLDKTCAQSLSMTALLEICSITKVDVDESDGL